MKTIKNFLKSLKEHKDSFIFYFLLACYGSSIVLLCTNVLSEKWFSLIIALLYIAIITPFAINTLKDKKDEDDSILSTLYDLFFWFGIILGIYFFASLTFYFMPFFDKFVRIAIISFVFIYPAIRLFLSDLSVNSVVRISLDVLKYTLGCLIGVIIYLVYFILLKGGLMIESIIKSIF
jgi:hypothetical protein